MSTARTEIAAWFDDGVKKGSTHMLIVCDTFDHDDCPVYVSTDADVWRKYNNPGDMQRVMEVYDLRADKAEQLTVARAMRLPPQPPGATE